MTRRYARPLSTAFLTLLPTAVASADIRLPGLFSDHMVLQANRDVPVRGHTHPGDSVTVEIRGTRALTKADAQGHFQATLPPLPPNPTPADLTITNGHGERLTVRDVLIGQVWLGSGQSNMGFPVSRAAGAPEFIAAADHPEIRLYTVPRKASPTPVDDDGGHWVVCTPQAVPGFSAVLYHFGRTLHDHLRQPIGLIHSSWGGTPIQSWTPRTGFADAEFDSQRAEMLRVYGPKPSPTPPTTAPDLSHMMPAQLYNGMIAPLTTFPIRGVVWYQGENNVHQGDGDTYATRFKTLTTLWRAAWNDPDLPFYFAQLAPYARYQAPAPDALLTFWQQQYRIAAEVPHTAIAPTADVGDPNDIHPTAKHPVGQRLAALALADTYGQADTPHAGPTYAAHTIEGAKVRVHFTGATAGLTTRDGRPPTGFELAGPDGHFAPAQATLDGPDALVWSDDVKHPVSVRLGWSPGAAPNLQNHDGWPALQFRAD